MAPQGTGSYAVTAYFTNKPITTITTNPTGLGFTVQFGGINYYYYGPQNFSSDFFGSWTPGSSQAIASWTPQQPYSINSRFSFQSWSDGGALAHNIVVPSTASTVTASFTPQFVPIAYATPSCAANVTLSPSSPSGDGFYSKGTKLTVAETPASGWILTGWLQDLKGKAKSQSLTVNDEELAVANFNTSATALAVTALSPASLPAGAPGHTLTIKGKGFTGSSIVFVNNSYRVSQFVSASEITVPLTTSDLASAGGIPGGGLEFPEWRPLLGLPAAHVLRDEPVEGFA